MRITNNMMLHNTSVNINGNKINVDTLNNQMSSQKKIQRPSDDPIIAIRALRLRSTLSEIDQYFENNIPDAEMWMDVTETALTNMEKLLRDIRTQCEYGASDQLGADDRNAILEQLTKLQAQVYSEGNTDYANRTVFTGYRTNQKLTFMDDDVKTSYEITQNFKYSDIQEYRYYSGNVTIPTTKDEVEDTTAITNPQESTYDRIRLSYGEVDADPTITVEPARAITVTSYATMGDWEAASADGYEIADGEAVFIQATGELILSESLSSDLRSDKAELSVTYTKTGFSKGEVRPEYYYNCTDITDPVNPIKYEKYDADGNEIYQDINYVVATNQTLTVNTNASDVFDASIGRDVGELINVVQAAIDANKKVADIEAMQKMEQYASDDCQAALEEWLAAAQKEAAYANDHMQKLYNSYIGNCDKYLEKVNLALTDVGSKGVSLEMIKNRLSNQQTTIETLKSKNEDRDLSDIIVDYTAAYTAYQASLQAASKINQNSLLTYL